MDWIDSFAASKQWLVIVGVFVLSYLVSLYLTYFYKGKKLPHPIRTLLPFGIDAVLMRLFASDEVVLDQNLRSDQIYGPNKSLYVLGQRVVILNDPDSIAHFLAKNFENYPKGQNQSDIFHEFLGQGIFASDGPAWRNQRNISKVHFMKDDLEAMVPVFCKHGHDMIQILNEHVVTKKPIDMQDHCLRFTLDSVGEILFGYNFDSLRSSSRFANSFDAVQQNLMFRLNNPMWKFFEAIFGKKRLDANVEILSKIAYEIVDNALNDKNIDSRHDLLAHFIRSKSETGEPHSRTYLRDMLMNFMLAGRDTTGVLLSWSLLMIAEHPEVERKLVEEIDRVVGRTEDPLPENIKELRYMKQFLNEVLRLFPSVPTDARMCLEDDILPDGHVIPKGAVVTYSAYCVHRNPRYFGSDADKFDPERWGPDRVGSIRPFYFIPFHAGPRMCLGQNMAYTEARVLLTMLLQRFRFSKAPGSKIVKKRAIILTSSTGNQMIVSARTD